MHLSVSIQTAALILCSAFLPVQPAIGAPTPKAALASKVSKAPRAAGFAEVLGRPLSLAEALNMASGQNAVILAARHEVEAQFGVAVQTRAIVLPKVLAATSYGVRQDDLIETNRGRDVGLVNNQAWSSDVRLVQSIYEGGRLVSALRQTRLIREQALLDYQTTAADVLLRTRVAYDNTLLAAEQIKVNQAAVTQLAALLDRVTKQVSVGTLSEFEQVRAEVELANAEPPLIRAQNDYLVSKQNLVQLLGFDVPDNALNSLPLKLSTPLVARTYSKDLPAALAAAEANRTELASLRTSEKLNEEAITVARAGNKPSVQAFAGYEATSRLQSRNAADYVNGGMAGVQANWPIFDGLLTQGRVKEARARRDATAQNLNERRRLIILQVRSAWARMDQSQSILASQSKNVGRAQRALDLSRDRYEAGTTTQVEVLSAQTALTEATGNYVQALRDCSVAYSELLRATGEDLQPGGAVH